ncbi:MAG: hypothetical protein A2Z74_01790 [Chloroflexi bacterium RBG_13_46_9]|jgi:hypothetical protein|nr:MAG: hypothetical protein A2Z74_01790 [Chloroflexi bacterium RBG_13_46_9]
MIQADSPEIILFTQTEVLSGSIFISTIEGRLLDELNGRITAAPENRDRFLILSDVIIEHMDGRQEKTAAAYVNRDTIQMAATSSTNTSRGIGGKPGPKPYPFTEKIPVPVKIVMTGYEITGNMYRVSHQKVEHVLIEKSKFIPLTDASINSALNNKQWQVPFLAVNKEHILSLFEQST